MGNSRFAIKNVPYNASLASLVDNLLVSCDEPYDKLTQVVSIQP